MKFTDYVRRDRCSENFLIESDISKEHGLTRRLHEAVKLKNGDLATYKDNMGSTVGLIVVGGLINGYIAVEGSYVNVYTQSGIKGRKNFNLNDIGSCVYIDGNGKVEGKYPVSVFDGSYEDFEDMLDDKKRNRKMFLSDLAKDMAEDLRIEDEDGFDIQAFIYALEDGEVCEQLENLGYTQEDIEKVHDELWKIKR